jgi:hypothetical protein
VVQVVGDHRYVGTLFVVGDVADGKVHGFHMVSCKKEFITVPGANCAKIGESKVRSRQSCSFRWMSQHEPR